MLKKTLLTITALALLAVGAATPAAAQAPSTALLYNDGAPELQEAYTALFDELSAQGATVSATADAADFANQLTTGAYDVYGAFGLDANLLGLWKGMVPDNAHYISATLAADGDIATEYTSFMAANVAPVTVGRTNHYVGQAGAPKHIQQDDFDSRTSHRLSTDGPSPLMAPGGLLMADGAAAISAPAMGIGWPWDGLIEEIGEIFTGWLDDILEWVECVGSCALDCVDTFLDNIPEGVEIEVTVEAQTTPPGVKTSITVKASGRDAVKVMKEYAKMMACIGGCIASC